MCRRSPGDKKRLSYEKDRRRAYGENDKASRKRVRDRKHKARRVVRRTARHEISKLGDAADPDSMEAADARIRGRPPDGWRKEPDEALGSALARRLARRRAFDGKDD